jgi:hypothetical protein
MGDAGLDSSVDGALEGHGRAPDFSVAPHHNADMADPIDSALYALPASTMLVSARCSSLTRAATYCGG